MPKPPFSGGTTAVKSRPLVQLKNRVSGDPDMLKNSSCGRFAAKFIFAITASAILAGALIPAHAALVVNGVNMFRDFRGPNDVGVAPGDRIQYGGNIVGGSAGATLSAVYPPSGFSDPAAPCGPLAVNANFCSNGMAFNANRLASPWNLTFTKGVEALTIAGPSMVGANLAVPHPTSVTISGGGATPTISWTLPAGYTTEHFNSTSIVSARTQ